MGRVEKGRERNANNVKIYTYIKLLNNLKEESSVYKIIGQNSCPPGAMRS